MTPFIDPLLRVRVCVCVCEILILAMPLSLASGWPQLRGRWGQTAAGTERETEGCSVIIVIMIIIIITGCFAVLECLCKFSIMITCSN